MCYRCACPPCRCLAPSVIFLCRRFNAVSTFPSFVGFPAISSLLAYPSHSHPDSVVVMDDKWRWGDLWWLRLLPAQIGLYGNSNHHKAAGSQGKGQVRGRNVRKWRLVAFWASRAVCGRYCFLGVPVQKWISAEVTKRVVCCFYIIIASGSNLLIYQLCICYTDFPMPTVK